MSERKPYVGGNWKMNTDLAGASELARSVADGLATAEGVEAAVFPPFPYLIPVGGMLRDRHSNVKLGAQDLYPEPDGAFTGEVSIAMLQDCGVKTVLVGHSERRHVIGEDEALLARKTSAVLESGLECVLCIGEKLEEREAGQTNAVNERQLRSGLGQVTVEQMARLTVAYEPVWAIGTGKTATPDDAQTAHAHIRGVLADLFGDGVAQAVRIQYGGSVKPHNAHELFSMPDIDGGLIGGAALKAADFVPIVKAAAGAPVSG
ncbi:MAG: triose-phosphate isomerase [Planctomycetota bacterium]